MKQRGIGIIETLVYIAILSVVFVIVVNTVVVVSDAYGKARVKRALASEAEIALERIIREVRIADSVNIGSSVLGSSPGSLSLNTIVSPTDTTPISREFLVQSNALMLREGAGTPQPLTSKVNVTNLVFYHISSPSSPSEAVSIQITLEDGVGKFYKSQNYYGTAVMRRSY